MSLKYRFSKNASFGYRLFGAPKTFDDAVDLARSGSGKADVFLKPFNPYGEGDDTSLVNRHWYVIVKVDEREVRLRRHDYNAWSEPNGNSRVVRRAEAERAAVKDLAETARKLEALGLDVTCNGGSIVSVERGVWNYDRSIRELKNQLALC